MVDNVTMKPMPVETSPAKGMSVTPAQCVGTVAPVADATYNGSGYTGLAGQAVDETPTSTARAIQAVVAFPDPGVTQSFYNTQLTAWQSCQDTDVTVDYPNERSDHVHVAAVTKTDGILTALIGPSAAATNRHSQCQRALTVRNNVVIDVRVCSPNLHDAGLTLARNIAQRVPG